MVAFCQSVLLKRDDDNNHTGVYFFPLEAMTTLMQCNMVQITEDKQILAAENGRTKDEHISSSTSVDILRYTLVRSVVCRRQFMYS